MKVFLLSDPHFGRDMSRFGEVWHQHEAVIQQEWRCLVAEDDLVLIPGDFSWATTTKTIRAHMEIVDGLPGEVVISPGNHCRFWKKTPRLHYDRITYLHDDHLPLAPGWTLAATMGWDSPESPWWKEEMRPEFEATVLALRSTLENAVAADPSARILLMIHYPPRWKAEETPTAFEEVIAEFPVELVVYGHIHGVDLPMAHNGLMKIGDKELRYENGSADRLEMKPLSILELPGKFVHPRKAESKN